MDLPGFDAFRRQHELAKFEGRALQGADPFENAIQSLPDAHRSFFTGDIVTSGEDRQQLLDAINTLSQLAADQRALQAEANDMMRANQKQQLDALQHANAGNQQRINAGAAASRKNNHGEPG